MKEIDHIFSKQKNTKPNPLFVFEMANNHMGDVEHGLKIIRDIYEISKNFDFNFAFKFQYRDINTFIHPDYKNRMDLKYVKRFSETKLTEENFLTLKAEAEKFGFITICTPFDEASVDMIVKHNYDVLKIASCSSTDWPLLEKIATTNKPIIVSTGGTKLEDIDKVVSFLKNRGKKFAIMHCVGEYPTLSSHLQLNQIDLFKKRYEGIVVGFSTHEEPDNFEAIKIAVAKGASIFEKHVAINSGKYEINNYSSTPDQLEKWLQAAKQIYEMCGIVGERAPFSEKQLSDIRQFQRGVFASRDIQEEESIDAKNTFFAFPNQEGQMLANNMSKYTIFTARKKITKNAPIMSTDVNKLETRDKVYKIVLKARTLLMEAKIPVSNQLDFEISHHYGIDKFYEFGAVIITCINREYAKKLILVFPGQQHPSHTHKQKEETFHVLYGSVVFELNNVKHESKAGNIMTVERGIKHSFSSKNGAIFEEISTTHYKDDSFYDDEKIINNPNRKTKLSYWII